MGGSNLSRAYVLELKLQAVYGSFFAVGQLDLHLCFIDLKSGRKITLILDVTCLKW